MDEGTLLARIAALEARVEAIERRQGHPPPPAAPPRPAPPKVPAPAARPAVPERDVESFLGADWLAKAGVLVLALGVVFFLKLAFDQGWISLAARYYLGLAGGLALFVLGDALRSRRLAPSYPQIVAGGGAVIAYVTAYAGYAFDPLRDALGMTLPVTLFLLALVSAALGAYAAWRDLPILAGTSVGLATALLAPAGDVGTASVLYATFLDAALLTAAAWRGWGQVGLLALVGADLVLFAGLAHEVPPLLVAALALGVNGLAIFASERGRSPSSQLDNGHAFLAAILLFMILGVAGELGGVIEDPYAWSALGVGVASLAAAAALQRTRKALGLAGAVLLLFWPFVHFEGSPVQALAWLLLGALGFGFASLLRPARNALHVASLVAGALALFSLFSLHASEDFARAQPLAAIPLHALLLLLGAGIWEMRRRENLLPLRIRYAALALALAAPTVLLGNLLAGWGIGIAWAVLALATVGLGLALDQRDLRLGAFALFGLVLGRVFLVDFSGLSLASRVVTFLLVGALLLAGAYLYARARPANPR